MRTKRIWWLIPGSFSLKIFAVMALFFPGTVFRVAGQGFASGDETGYQLVFGEKYTEAVNYLSGNDWISDTLAVYSVTPAFAKALIFPELIRYSVIRDKIETRGLYTLYVQYGFRYSDFSIGRFQMKPSFAEQVERDVKKAGGKTARLMQGTDTTDTPGARLARVNRLESTEWQVKYLIGFIEIMDLKYSNIFKQESTEKLRFYAAAYNSGYWLDETAIRKIMSRNYFHTELVRSEICYNYGDIAASYYESMQK